MTFAEKLFVLRKERGLTQTEVAKELGIVVRAYQRYE